MADLKKLFKQAQNASEAVETAQQNLDVALATRSEVIKAFVAGANGQKGPFKLPDGSLVTVRCRTSYEKTEDGDFVMVKDANGKPQKIQTGETWFFVALAESNAIEI